MNNILFAQFEKNFATGEPLWIKGLRQEGWDQFNRLGFPTQKLEEWKYTNVRPIQETPFRLADFDSRSSLGSQVRLEDWSLGDHKNIHLTFLNGNHIPSLSSTENLTKGAEVGHLSQFLKNSPELIEPHLARYASSREHPFVALSSAFLKEGAFVYIPKNHLLRTPIELIFLASSEEEPIFSHPRNLIVIEEGSEVQIIENYAGLNQSNYFTNVVTEIVLKERAILHHYKIQKESNKAFHLSHLNVHQESRSQFHSYSVSLGGSLTRNDLETVLDAEGSECSLNGLYLGSDAQHIDNHTVIDHAKPYCTSNECYKGILDGKSQAVFNGQIIVRPNASKTNARQTNKNLLLSKEATINTKPLLEIYNNDVKCNHGATIGRLDENQIFYLRSRGIKEKDAKHLLTYAFASDWVEQIQLKNLKNKLKRLLFERLISANSPPLKIRGGWEGL